MRILSGYADDPTPVLAGGDDGANPCGGTGTTTRLDCRPYSASFCHIPICSKVATANTISRMLSALPPIGAAVRVMFYDLHTLQQRFYLHSSAIATMHSTIPLIQHRLRTQAVPKITAIACT